MHIGFLTTEYPPLPSGGIGTSVRNLARGLVTAGHRVTVIGWGQEAAFDDVGVAVRFLGHTRLPGAGWLLHRLRAQRALRRLVRTAGLEIVEAHDWCGPSAGLRLPCPLVVRCHGSATYFAHLLDGTVRPTVRYAETLALRRATAVAAVSRFTATVTHRLFHLEAPITVIPNGIDPTHFTPAAPTARRPQTVLFFGTLVRKKGVLDLCRIFSRLVETHPQAELELIGPDSRDEKSGGASTWALCQEQLSPAARARTTYHGPLTYDRVQEAVRTATVCAFPSYAEALPLAWLEAMACALPLVVYDIGWAPEVVADGETGFLIPAGDTAAFARALATLLDDAALNARCGTAGWERMRAHFAAPVVARANIDWYRRVLDTWSPR